MNLKPTNLLLILLSYILLAIIYLLCIPAVYFTFTAGTASAYIFTYGFIILIPGIYIVYRKKKYAYWLLLTSCTIFLIIFFNIPPSNNRHWAPDVALLPSISINNNMVTVKNIRNNKYRSEFEYTPHYYSKTFNVNNIDSLDYILSYWDGNTNIAHSMLSFGFKDDSHLCVSVETRREVNEEQTTLRGFYNQYELIYILADEKDLLGLRTNFRKEEVYVYPLKIKKKIMKNFFLQILGRAEEVEIKPQFYNTIKHNCFTSLFRDIEKVTGRPVIFDYRHILNGRSDELAYERGIFFDKGISFINFKKRHHINQYIKGGNIPDNYSSIIRKKFNSSNI